MPFRSTRTVSDNDDDVMKRFNPCLHVFFLSAIYIKCFLLLVCFCFFFFVSLPSSLYSFFLGWRNFQTWELAKRAKATGVVRTKSMLR